MRPVMLALTWVLALASAGCQRKPDGASGTGQAHAAQGAPAPAHSTTVAEPVAPAAAVAGSWAATPLGRDMDRICNVIERAGVAHLSEGEQAMATIAWLPKNIESEAGREFLASIANLEGNAKADALEQGARRVGLAECALAQLWRE